MLMSSMKLNLFRYTIASILFLIFCTL
uniref:Uncharacterized protein n=1 Tax=Arundo donax TaxID=35708 RepID=A0A0A9C4Y8_ARUDO